MPKPAISFDNRPRYGWCNNLDLDPQIILEKRPPKSPTREFRPVVVIPMPYTSDKVRMKIKAFTLGTLWPKDV